MYGFFKHEDDGQGPHSGGRFGRHRQAHCGPGGHWGRGPWAGRHEGRGRGEGRGEGGRRGRMFGPGDLRLVLLSLIEQEPRHGYDLIKAIEALFGGGYAPSPGVVYPTLSMLSDKGLIAGAEDAGGKRVFSLTKAGKVWLDENRAAVDGVMQRMALAARRVAGEQTPEIVREAFMTLRQAVVMKPGGWSEPETAKVVETLMKAVHDISGE
ncbi:PadR family transcriptional regulator [Brevundimonas sp.]|uniref:PadR family transcriptional regulator n=2 Tax=Brevundimonas sp. TaxID=1871086 RepID=UPI0040339521